MGFRVRRRLPPIATVIAAVWSNIIVIVLVRRRMDYQWLRATVLPFAHCGRLMPIIATRTRVSG
jgi:hypothetical protein